MQFRQHQRRAQIQTARLLAWFAVLLAGLTVAVNVVIALMYKLALPFSHGFPALFFETNTGLIVLFVLGGCLMETWRLRDGGGQRVARWIGGRAVLDGDDALERRLLNVVDEMALASGQAVPQVFVLPKEDAINAFVAGWGGDDVVLCVTRGALERLTRAELQGLVAHEFGHVKGHDLPLTMRLLALVWGLSLVHGWGRMLMSPDDEGHVRPLPWFAGFAFAAVGWLGWMAGRLLQAAVSRQRELLADACAVQFTRTREGLGNVLRKIWHDQRVLAGRMQHPAAEMVASLLLHEPRGPGCLATHPRLSERIRALYGVVMGPMPAPLLRAQAPEPRHAGGLPLLAEADQGAAASTWPTASVGESAAHGTTGTGPSAGDSLRGLHQAQSERQERAAADREAQIRLKNLTGPTERRLAVLALMTDPSNARERNLWRKMAEGVHDADRIQDSVADLLPNRRVPEFERLCATIAGEPIEQRRTVVESARDLLRADGRVSARERLWWLALRHRMGVQPNRQAPLRPMAGPGGDLQALTAEQQASVITLSAYMARFIPVEEPGAAAGKAGRAWFKRVAARCGVQSPPSLGEMPDADALMHALAGVQELPWMMRPLLLKAWVEEALNKSPQGLLSDDAADALRLMAGLIDSPLPPVLEAHYAHHPGLPGNA